MDWVGGGWLGLPTLAEPPASHRPGPGTGRDSHSPDAFVEAEKLLVRQPLALEDGDHPVVDAAGGERGELHPNTPGPS